MGGLLESVGSGIGNLYANTIGLVAQALSDAASQVGSALTADPRLAIIAVAALALLFWLTWRR